MLKLSTTYTKKVQGAEEYSSNGYHVAIECEAPDEAVLNPQGLRQRLESLFAEARQAIEKEIARDRGQLATHANGAPVGIPAATPPPHHGNGVSSNGEAASARQVQYLISLASRSHGMNMAQLATFAGQQVGNTDVNALTKRQATRLIETLK